MLLPLPLPRIYRGVVSSGTFTHGHVGPAGLNGLLDVALPGALFALSINAAVYRRDGFDRAFAALSGRITEPSLIDVRIYGAGATTADPTHAEDRALIALFHSR